MLLLLPLALMSSACGGDSCRAQADCDQGYQCDGAELRGTGTCVLCPAEVPYDGADNDCNPETRDRDLDGDGDNGKDAPLNPGTDCDDADPLVSGRMAEMCGDGKDNDCDDAVDEAPCGDTLAPTVSFVNPVDGGAISGVVSVELSAMDDGAISKIELYAGGVLRGATTDTPYRVSLDTSGMPEGLTQLRAVVTDAANKTGEATINVVVDNTSPPFVSIAAPQANRAYGGTLQVDLTATDAAGVASVAILVDGVTITSLTAAPYTYAIDTRSLAEGDHTLEIRARDQRGNEGTTTRTFAADNVLPDLVITPGNGTSVSRTVNFSVAATDASGIDTITSGAASSGTSPLTFDIDFETMPSGDVVISATAVDRAIVNGGAGHSRTASVTVIAENLGPSVTLTSPSPTEYYGGQATISGTVVDPLGISLVEVRLDGAVLQTGATPGISASVDTRTLSDGPHALVILTRDSLNNELTTNETLWVDNTGPVIGSAPVDGTTVGGRLTLSLLATDPAGIIEITGDSQTSTTSPLQLSLDFDLTPDGAYAVTVTARDGAIIDGQVGLGNSATDTINLVVDNPGPALTFVRPSAILGYGGTVTLEVDATDPNGVQQVILRRGAQTLATLTTPPFEAVLDTAPLADGSHNLEAIATDGLGNVSNLVQALRVDHTGPTITFTAPAPGATVQATIPVTGGASDPSGIREVTLGALRSAQSTFNFNFDTASLANGNTPIIVEARDNAVIDDQPGVGNLGSGSITVNVQNPQNTPPSVSITSPLQDDGVYRTMTFSANASSPAGITRVELRVNGDLVASDTTAPYTTTVDVSAFVGTLTLEAMAVGGNNATATAQVVVSVTAPPSVQVAEQLNIAGLGTSDFDLGDIDGDGVRDLLTGGSSVTWRAGLGGFEFGPPTSLGGTAIRVALADLEGDGDLDAVALTPGALEVHIAQTQGTFLPRRSVALGSIQASVLALGDLDGDGDMDAVVGRGMGGGDFVVVHQTAAGVFGVVATRGGIGSVTDIEVTDIDNDSTIDVVVGRSAMGSNVVSVYRNADGLGTFTGAALDTQLNGPAYTVDSGDLNGDSYPDLVLGVLTPLPGSLPGVIVRIGNPATPGQYDAAQSATHWLPEITDVCVGDLDRDGDLDLFAASSAHNGGRVFLNSGTGTFVEQRRYTLGRSPNSARIVDLDSDNRPDLLLVARADNAIIWARGLPSTQLFATPSVSLDRVPVALVSAEFAGGGLPDLAVAMVGSSPVPPGVVIYRNDGAEVFTPTSETPVTRAITSMAVGNVDGAFGLDLSVGSDQTSPAPTVSCQTNPCGAGLVCNSSQLCETITANVLLSNGAGGFSVRNHTLLNRPRGTAIGDVVAGGNDEVIFTFDAGATAGSIVFGNSTTILHTSATQQGATALLVGDFAAPYGLLDYLVANRTTSNITLNRQQAGGFAVEETYNTFAQVSGLASGLLAGDNRLDLVAIASSGVVAMPGDPLFTFVTPTSYSGGSQPSDIATADLNGDGLSDAVTLNAPAEQVAILLARPQGGFHSPDLLTLPENPVDLITTDLNNDGLHDIIVVSQGDDNGLTVLYGR
ncbi:MAG: VCBS repeat-containing protein [Deltaproteobacteria bacterium]|nr:VCBS repeat-containing protein [Deltaproteobacteria bacterium]